MASSLKRKRSGESIADDEPYITKHHCTAACSAEVDAKSSPLLRHCRSLDNETTFDAVRTTTSSNHSQITDSKPGVLVRQSDDGRPTSHSHNGLAVSVLSPLGDASMSDEYSSSIIVDDNDDYNDDDDDDDEQNNENSDVGISTSDSETTSSSGSDSESSDADDESSRNDRGVAYDRSNVGSVLQIPSRRPAIAAPTSSQLRSRLSGFLPQIQRANQQLELADDLLHHQIDHVGNDESHYIEMNLGLGVLQESTAAVYDGVRLEESSSSITSTSTSDNSSDGDQSEDDGHGHPGCAGVLAQLTGQRRTAARKPVIEELSRELHSQGEHV